MVLGPCARQILADYGADVIKIEASQGDLMGKAGATKSVGLQQNLTPAADRRTSVAFRL